MKKQLEIIETKTNKKERKKTDCITFLLKTFSLHIDGFMFPYFVPISFVER